MYYNIYYVVQRTQFPLFRECLQAALVSIIGH